MSACNQVNDVDVKLDEAEMMLGQSPDSALTMLRSMDKEELKSAKEKARYGVMMSMALDKNFIDTTTFDIIKPALDYYLSNGTPDEKMTVLYYKGRIHQNRGDDDNAMASFLKAREIREATDTLLMAHLLVAQGVLYYKQYKTREFVENNLEAASLYHKVGSISYEAGCYAKSLNRAVALDDRLLADSIKRLCERFTEEYPEEELALVPSLISYTVEYGDRQEIEALVKSIDPSYIPDEIKLDLALGNTKIDRPQTALSLLESAAVPVSTHDSLRWLSVKGSIFENLNQYPEALATYKEYISCLDRYHTDLFTHDLLFAEKKHNLEIANMKEQQGRKQDALILLSLILCLLFIAVLLYCLYYRNRTQRLLVERNNSVLKLEQENLNIENERLEVERRRLEVERSSVELDKEKKELELDRLMNEVSRLENERNDLESLLEHQKEMSKPLLKLVRKRLGLLNGLLASVITNNDTYAKPLNKLMADIHKDRKKFMASTRVAFSETHPAFIAYLASKDLTEDEIEHICLYGLGLRGKDVGEYLKSKRHYNISSSIRKKLGIDAHDTNLGIYIRELMETV